MSELNTFTSQLQEIEAITDRLTQINSLETLRATDMRQEQELLSRLDELNGSLPSLRQLPMFAILPIKNRRVISELIELWLALTILIAVLSAVLAGVVLLVQEVIMPLLKAMLTASLW